MNPRIREAVSAVPDPELAGVTIGELGMIAAVSTVAFGPVERSSNGHRGLESGVGAEYASVDRTLLVELTPTFLGCPALDLIAADVAHAVASIDGSVRVDVRFVAWPIWTPDRISDVGRERLAARGIAVPDRDGRARCPFCGAEQLSSVARAGPTSCRSVAWCCTCRNVVELMRRAEGPVAVSILPRPYVHV